MKVNDAELFVRRRILAGLSRSRSTRPALLEATDLAACYGEADECLCRAPPTGRNRAVA
jgi:hypothetical protein